MKKILDYSIDTGKKTLHIYTVNTHKKKRHDTKPNQTNRNDIKLTAKNE